MPTPTAALAKRALAQFATPERKTGAARFFKTGKGEYGEGDVFIGVTVPESRLVAKEFRALPLAEVDTLITSRIHEERLTGLFILVAQFERATDEAQRKKRFQLYRKRMAFVNNWDLVDLSRGQHAAHDAPLRHRAAHASAAGEVDGHGERSVGAASRIGSRRRQRAYEPFAPCL